MRRAGRTSIGHLVVRAAHAARLDLDRGLHIVDRLAEDSLSGSSLAPTRGSGPSLRRTSGPTTERLPFHIMRVDELGHQRRLEHRIRQALRSSGLGLSTTSASALIRPTQGVLLNSLVGLQDLGRLAPYLERLLPAALDAMASRVPLITW